MSGIPNRTKKKTNENKKTLVETTAINPTLQGAILFTTTTTGGHC
jgi:hypothetical protein